MFGIKKGVWLSQPGECKSDDSDDSDFVVDDETGEAKRIKRPKSKKRRKEAPQEKSRPSKRNRLSTNEIPIVDGNDWANLPRPALERIFSHSVRRSANFLTLNTLGEIAKDG